LSVNLKFVDIRQFFFFLVYNICYSDHLPLLGLCHPGWRYCI